MIYKDLSDSIPIYLSCLIICLPGFSFYFSSNYFSVPQGDTLLFFFLTWDLIYTQNMHLFLYTVL